MSKGFDIKQRLSMHHLTYSWLICQLQSKGISIDISSLSSILNGARKGPKADQVITESDMVLAKYEALYL